MLALLGAGCATHSPVDPARSNLQHQLLAAAPLTVARDPEPLPDLAIVAVDDDMRRFVAAHVDPGASSSVRLRQLLAAIVESGRFDVEYEDRTYTAVETFHRRAGNCLSFTAMFIALAREAGIDATFQEVAIPPDWSRDGDSLVLNRHIDALVRGADGRERVVDFNVEDFRTSYDHQPVSDARAFAHFHSNLGVEAMQAGDTGTALAQFRKAIGYDAEFTPVWVNLGTLYSRNGVDDWAVATWQHALRLAPGESVALSNLERVFRQRGEIAAADGLRERVRRHREQNPYYRYFLAERAFAAGDYPAAITQLRAAIARKKNDDRFYALLAASCLRNGDTVAAQRWMARAAEVAADEDLQRRYHSKLDLLRDAG